MHLDPSSQAPVMGAISPAFSSAPPGRNALFEPRPLTRSERRRGDLYLFHSPKLGRPVELLHRGRLAMALDLEFDPQIVDWVERPRLLTVKDRDIELCFWTRQGSGRERFLLFVDESSTTIDPKMRLRLHRASRDLIEAANLAGIALEFVFEADLVARASALNTWFRLLPYVQTANTLPHIDALEHLVTEAFSVQARMSFLQLEQTLDAHAAPDVRAVACHLIHRGVLQLDMAHPLTRLSVIGKEAGR